METQQLKQPPSESLAEPLLQGFSHIDADTGLGPPPPPLGLESGSQSQFSNVASTPEVRRRTTGGGAGEFQRNGNNTMQQEEEDGEQGRRRRGFLFSSSNNRPRWRILDRDSGFFQSRGRWRVQRLSREARLERQRSSVRCNLRKPWSDWFHTLAYKKTCSLMIILFLSYVLIIIAYAYLYYALSVLGATFKENTDGSIIKLSFCDMDINNRMEAMYFSLSTMTTIGYGVSDYYFGDCWTPLITVLSQCCCAITYNAIAIGLLFQRISRGRKRGKTIIFSSSAVIRRVKGVPYLMFRIGELRRYQLIEAHVRVYCIRHERILHRQEPTDITESDVSTGNSAINANSSTRDFPPTGLPHNYVESAHFLTRNLKLLHPDEEVGSHILMCLPQVIVHRMDESSPLIPPGPIWYDANGIAHKVAKTEMDTANAVGRRGNGITDMEGEIFYNSDSVVANTTSETSNVPDGYERQRVAESPVVVEDDEIENMKNFLRDREVEIVVLVEGTDELTGSAIQSRYSYTEEDLKWNHTFKPCVFHSNSSPQSEGEQRGSRSRGFITKCFCCRCTRNAHEPVCIVDYSRFHDTIEAPIDCAVCPYVPH